MDGGIMYPTMTSRIRVTFRATDPLTQAGTAAALRARPEVNLLADGEEDAETVVVVITDRLDLAGRDLLRTVRAQGLVRIVLVLGEIDDSDLLAAVELGVRAVTRRADASPEALVELVRKASTGDAALPPDLLGRLFTQVSRLQRHVLEPKGLDVFGMSEREKEVLRLVAQGYETKEIAERMCYSQRTVKTILHDVTNRFQLRNRSHAVAYAIREGLI
jgi:DNA-binding NarL/FixJ family response regulator